MCSLVIIPEAMLFSAIAKYIVISLMRNDMQLK
jgi:hypothetical protein